MFCKCLRGRLFILYGLFFWVMDFLYQKMINVPFGDQGGRSPDMNQV